MMYFFDTDSLSRAHIGQGKVAERIRQAGVKQVATTVVTAIETLRGRHEFLIKAANGTQLIRAQHLLEESEKMLSVITIVPIDERAAAEFDKLRQMKGLRGIGRADLLIGCIALA